MRYDACAVRLASGLLALAIVNGISPSTRIEAAAVKFDLEVRAGDQDRRNSPVTATIDLPPTLAGAAALHATLLDDSGKPHDCQLTRPSLLADAGAGPNRRELHFIVDQATKRDVVHWTATVGDDAAPVDPKLGFQWQDTPSEHADLTYNGRPVLRYMYQPLDESTKETREATFKVYHHVFDPTGETLLTKGAGGKFTHHRGLFFGFNKVSYDGGKKQADVWHCSGKAFQSHDDLLASEAGPVLGRDRLAIGWHGQENEVFATEHRELTAYAPQSSPAAGMLIEFASRVRPTSGEVKLDGDPQHAGFHFRAAQEVADVTFKETYYLRPDGIGKPGETRNWDVKDPKSHVQVNFPWKGMSFIVAGKRYTVAYLDLPTNPKESRFSERDYGRFGSYFEYTMTPEKPLEVHYRVWIQAGEMTLDEIVALDADFVHPIEVTAKIAP
jgi:hypothetical protein